MKLLKGNKAITLIALIITIIVLLILAGVAINTALGENGIINKSQMAKDIYSKQEAIEKMELKLSTINIKCYSELNRSAELQDIVNELNDDDEIEYVSQKSNKEELLPIINVGDASSIFTKLKKAPYEFEIGVSGTILKIDGEKYSKNNEVIDNNPPTASILDCPTNAITNLSINVTISQNDEESGLDLDNCKYIFNKVNSSELGYSEYENATNTEENDTLTLTPTSSGTWYIHLLTSDNKGNRIETVSNGINVKDGVDLYSRSCETGVTITNVDEGVKIAANSGGWGFVVFDTAIPVGKTVTVVYEHKQVASSSDGTHLKSCAQTHPDTNGTNRVDFYSNASGSQSWVVSAGAQYVGLAVNTNNKNGGYTIIKSITFQ